MAWWIRKTEGGSGGKRGHSRMTHWDHSWYLKEASDRVRRHHDKEEVEEQLAEIEEDH